MTTALRICPLCEATCGLTLTIEDGRVTGARGDREDVFSHGFICPKGASFAELDNDPDRLTAPLVRRDGELTEATWDEAYAVIAERLGGVIRDHGGASVGVYLGNPNAHNIAGSLYAPLIVRALRTRHVYTASTLDQMPKHVALGYMFGSPVAYTVPDLDRTDYLVIIGANPLVSNGSLATAADFPGEPWAVPKFYWSVFATRAFEAALDALTPEDLRPEWSLPSEEEFTFGYADGDIDAVVETDDDARDAKTAALAAHATQVVVGPTGRACALSNNVALPILGHEHYVLAAGDAGERDERGWETDLLAGLGFTAARTR